MLPKCANATIVSSCAFCGWSWGVLFMKTVSDWALLTFNCWNKKSGKFNIFRKRNYTKQNVFSITFTTISQLTIQQTYFSLKYCSHICLHLWEHFSFAETIHPPHRCGIKMLIKKRDSRWQDRIMDCFGDLFVMSSEKEQFITLTIWQNDNDNANKEIKRFTLLFIF